MSSTNNEQNNNIVNMRDFYNHDIRIALLEKSVSHIDSTMTEIKSDIRELRNYILGIYGIIGAVALTTFIAKMIAKVFGY